MKHEWHWECAFRLQQALGFQIVYAILSELLVLFYYKLFWCLETALNNPIFFYSYLESFLDYKTH
jgi:hypothetical protein